MSLIQQQVSIRHSIKRRSASALALVILAGITLAAQAQTVTTIFDFANSGGTSNPLGAGVQGRDGNYYGITYFGTVYKVTPSGTYTQLATMTGTQGQNCNGLTMGTDGNFYGTCFNGGDNGNSTGTFFKVTPTGTITVLHYFDGTFSGTTDGCYPNGVPVQASDGNFYGTTELCGVNDSGIVYKMTPAGVETVIHALAYQTEGSEPMGALILGSDGNLWGTANSNGTGNAGTVFKVSLTGTLKVIYSFAACSTTTACYPHAGLLQGTDGNYYGTTQQGGANNEGTVFKVTPLGVLTLLHSFNAAVDNGAYPMQPLTQGTDGNLYGVATDCFAGGCSPADLFEVTTKGAFIDIYNFPVLGGNNNSDPYSPLLLSTTGTFYGTTYEGGNSSAGTLYSLANGQSAFIALQQSSAREASSVNILGQGFSSSSVVKFGGTAATKIAVTGSTFIQAAVPAGALTGPVSVTTGSKTLTSLKTFKVLPKVISFIPPSGSVGTQVTITGTGFTQTTGVKFNGTVSTFTVNSDTQITATVPTGATTGKITVTTKGGSASSSTSFTVN
jgi:uncharacterized repeat protein (TIGR03803 family)